MPSKPPGTSLPQMPENAPQVLAPPYKAGDGVPWFRTPSDINPDLNFSTLAGRIVVLSFLGSLTQEPVNKIALELLAQKDYFDGRQASLALVTIDLRDAQSTATLNLPGTRLLFDFDRRISHIFGLVPDDNSTSYAPVTFILDERLRVIETVPVMNPEQHVRDVMEVFHRIPKKPALLSPYTQAPVLMIPNVFEDFFCEELIEGFTKFGGEESGFILEQNGKTVVQVDHQHKHRKDWLIDDDRVIRRIRQRMQRRLVPEILKAFQFSVTRMERYLVACYDGKSGGHFSAHRDNATKGDAHRRFSVTINLNIGGYDGGDLVFPEFGMTGYQPPTGGACVFSSSLLHETRPVTGGTRYCFVPFVYDDAAAKTREANVKYVNISGAA
jgi:peroxiredoxin